MKIKKINLKNWKSYDETGIEINELRHINIFIGPNNSGKSNLFKYFFKLKSIINSTIKDDKNGDEYLKKYYGKFNNMPLEFSNEDSWAWKSKDIEAEIITEVEDEEWKYGKPSYSDNINEVCLRTLHTFTDNRTVLSVMCGENTLIKIDGRAANPEVWNIEMQAYTDVRDSIKEAYDTLKYWEKFAENLVFIDPCRHYGRNSTSVLESDFDGSDVVDKIRRINIEAKKEWVQYKKMIDRWLSEILMEDISLELNAEGDIEFCIERGGETILSSLSQLGTGVGQLFMLFTYLFINKDNKINVFIEEPECNLHPDAVVKLIKILEANYLEHRFFITTHSMSLMDQINDKWSIHRVFRNEKNTSKFLPCKNLIEKYEVIDELGIRASQLLQTNIMIWIEGASDRIYLNKWIKDISKGELIEGKHYSFIMYGGANLKSYSLLVEDEYIDILSTSRYAYILCDSDKHDEEWNLKQRVKDLNTRINELRNSVNGYNSSIDDYVKLWITDGREIENYVPKDSFLQVLTTDDMRKKYIIENKNRINLKINTDLIKNKDFSQYESFDMFFAGVYEQENEISCTQEQIKKIAEHYSNKKVEIASRVVKIWTDEYYESNRLLKLKVIELVKFIKLSNGIVDE